MYNFKYSTYEKNRQHSSGWLAGWLLLFLLASLWMKPRSLHELDEPSPTELHYCPERFSPQKRNATKDLPQHSRHPAQGLVGPREEQHGGFHSHTAVAGVTETLCKGNRHLVPWAIFAISCFLVVTKVTLLMLKIFTLCLI